jgi:iron complex outermembrane receptor protein
VDAAKPECASITPDIYTGGKPDLGPEESKQWTAGVVWAPTNDLSFNVDWWSITKTAPSRTWR